MNERNREVLLVIAWLIFIAVLMIKISPWWFLLIFFIGEF